MSSKTKKSVLPSPCNTRLTTIVAHVDHGKTTFCDSLIEQNGIISDRLAGTIRYLDSMEEEQRRGITIRGKAIALKYAYKPTPMSSTFRSTYCNTHSNNTCTTTTSGTSNNHQNEQEMVIHLMDSPGHVDFSMEVSSSLQLCDSALLLVDVIEGMCARTHSILREVHALKLVPILVLNKLDRLVVDLGLNVNEAYVRIRNVVESVNAAASALINSHRAATANDNLNVTEYDENKSTITAIHSWNQNPPPNNNNNNSNNSGNNNDDDDIIERIWTFDPNKGNVIFASALYGWGFTIPSLARSLFKSKIIPHIKPAILRQYLFGDYQYHPPQQQNLEGRVTKWKQSNISSDEHRTMFAEFGLRPLWDLFHAVSTAALEAGIPSEIFNSTSTTSITSTSSHIQQSSTAIHNSTTTSSNNNSNSNNNNNSIKIKASTPGMNLVLPALSIGCTNPTTTTTNFSQFQCPTTLSELQTLLTKYTNATSETLILRALLKRHRPLSSCALDVICEFGPSPQDVCQLGGLRCDLLSLVHPSFPTVSGSSSSIDISSRKGDCNTYTKVEEREKESFLREYDNIQKCIQQCKGISSDDANDNEMSSSNSNSSSKEDKQVPTVAHICKFVATDRLHIHDPEFISSLEESDQRHQQQQSDINNNMDVNKGGNSGIILGVARVLSGILTTQNTYYCYGPKYHPSISSSSITTTTSDSSLHPNNNNNNTPPQRTIRLYLLMGASYIRVPYVPSGHLCAIYGVEDLQFKSMTLCDTIYGMPLKSVSGGLKPLVKVNVEATSAADTFTLEKGLAKLSLADPAIEVTATSKGERILACLGEIHLEQSIHDLKNIYCCCDNGRNEEIQLRISKPIVEFGESTDWFVDSEVSSGDGSNVNASVDIFEQFYNDSESSDLLRQVTIPPYCYEDGIGYAKRGRSRALISGRSGALSVRVTPLPSMVYECIRQGYRVEGSDEDLLTMGRVLGLIRKNSDRHDSSNVSQDVLDYLLSSLYATDANGNAMIESMGMTRDECIKGVLSPNKEIYVPPPFVVGQSSTTTATTTTEEEGKEEQQCSKMMEEGENLQSNDDENISLQKFNELKSFIRNGSSVKSLSSSDSQEASDKKNQPQNSNIPTTKTTAVAEEDVYACKIWKADMRGSAMAGFRSGCSAGPLCEEPIRGILVILEGVEIALIKQDIRNDKYNNNNSNSSKDDEDSSSPLAFHPAKPITGGMIVSAMRMGIRSALLSRPVRLVEGHLRLTLHSSLSGLGPLYAILSKRRGRVLSDTMVDGTDLISIVATIPQIESFGLGPELLEKSSGQVTAPELVFSHWEVLDKDPFWIPTSLEEREDYGEIIMNGDCSTGVVNHALKYIRMVRERKGLIVDSNKIVVAAEKQRTLARKK